jgi:transcriptional regulator of NAD metabolism
MQNADTRRKKILDRLKKSDKPLSASYFAEKLDVSRQIIVGDIALLRAEGEKINATPRGYVLGNEQDDGIQWQIACKHSSEAMKDELYAVVDEGCIVKDVIVDHPVYGQLTGELQLKSRYDVDQFIERVQSTNAKPLSFLTEGIHLHTLICPDEAAYQRIVDNLKKQGVLL